MQRFGAFVLISAFAATLPVAAKPLITSSEETLARLCLAQEEAPERLVEACEEALAAPDLTDDLRADLLVGLGDALSFAGRDEEAVPYFEAAIALVPSSARAHSGRGWSLRAIEDDAAAYEAFGAALEAETTASALAGRAATGRVIGAMSGAEAREYLEAALAIDPDYDWARREIGWSWFDEGGNEEALAVFEDTLARFPADVNAAYGAGRALLRLEEAEDALYYFNLALDGDPEDLGARIMRIIALRLLDRNAQALRDADRLIADHPDLPAGYVQRGLALVALERRSESLETFEAAEAAVEPSNSLLYWHADTLYYDGRYEEALELIRRATTLDGADSSDYLLMAQIALELEDPSVAAEAAETALELNPKDAWGQYYAAVAMVRSGDSGGGRARFDSAMAAGLPQEQVGQFARELIAAGAVSLAVQLRLRYPG